MAIPVSDGPVNARIARISHIVSNRSLQVRKEIRNKAWQNDGWAETVTKVSQGVFSLDNHLSDIIPIDCTIDKVNGLFYFDTTIIQSSQITSLTCIYIIFNCKPFPDCRTGTSLSSMASRVP